MSSLPKIDLRATGKMAVSLLDEFRAFAFKGNVVDLAIGVIIGGAFQQIINSLVKNVIMPLIGVLAPGDRPYTHWVVTLRGQKIEVGPFLADVMHFLITAAVLFVFLVKFLGRLLQLHKAQAAEAPKLTRDQQLLTEIRDLLRRDAPPATPSP